MSRDKQIEEMAKALTNYEKKLCDRLPKDKCLLTSAIHAQVSCDYCKIAEFLVNAGYRKASDVAEEIFAEIHNMLLKILKATDEGCYKAFCEDDERAQIANVSARNAILCAIYSLAELKKKYTKGGNGQDG